jgi:hypothetical protein
MPALLVAVLAALRSFARTRLELEAEILALQHQLAILQRQTPTRPRLGRADRWLWVLLSRLWPHWRGAIQLVTPDTVVLWHRRGFALYWVWKSRPRRAGRPRVGADIRALIRQMAPPASRQPASTVVNRGVSTPSLRPSRGRPGRAFSVAGSRELVKRTARKQTLYPGRWSFW